MAMMDVEMLAAREGVRYTVSIYNQAVDRGVYADLAAVFAEDAEMIISDSIAFQGRRAIIENLSAGAKKRGAYEPGNFQRHSLGNSIINILGPDTAKSVHFIMVITERGLDHSGVYIDDFVKLGERWMIKTRRANMEWVSEGSRFRSFPAHIHISDRDQLNIGLWETELNRPRA
jgi:hypothetical protein